MKMNTCLCGGKLEDVAVIKDSVQLIAQTCIKCGEVFFDAEEILRYELLTGRRKGVKGIKEVRAACSEEA